MVSFSFIIAQWIAPLVDRFFEIFFLGWRIFPQRLLGLGGRAGPRTSMSGSNKDATFREKIPSAQVRDRRASSDHGRELEVPMQRLTAGIPAKRPRCVAEIPPSRPRERTFWPSSPHVREVLSAPFASRTGSLTWGLLPDFCQRSGRGGVFVSFSAPNAGPRGLRGPTLATFWRKSLRDSRRSPR